MTCCSTASKDICITKGATFLLSLMWRAGEPLAPVDLTGSDAELTVFDRPGGAVLLECSTANGRITLGGAAGTIDVKVSADDTDAIEWRGGWYALNVTMSNGDVIRLLAGSAEVRP